MAYRVKLTPRAQKDVEELYRWVILRAPLQGAVWYNGLIDAIGSLADHPQRCPISSEGLELREQIRQLLYGRRPYRILFWIKGKDVQVLHVRRGARKLWNRSSSNKKARDRFSIRKLLREPPQPRNRSILSICTI